jgi:hypothetical protein
MRRSQDFDESGPPVSLFDRLTLISEASRSPSCWPSARASAPPADPRLSPPPRPTNTHIKASLRTTLVGAAALVGSALWWRRHPSACPDSQRFWVEAPHPFITRDRLREALGEISGARVLEVGPGTGYYSIPVAEWIGPAVSPEIFDLQREMPDHTLRRAEARGLANVTATQGDARSLPYDDASFEPPT